MKDLLRDLESYCCGETPGTLELLRAPAIEGWSTEIKRRGKEFVLVVAGEARRHPDYANGEPICTGAVLWFDRKARWIRTAHRIYELGERAAES